jgi:hypothetical protein
VAQRSAPSRLSHRDGLFYHAANADVARLQRRIVQHLPERVTFITNPDLQGTNNRAERESRPHAIERHRAGGARSGAGAKTDAINLSVVRTVHRHGGDFVDTFRPVRIACHEGGDFPTLVPGPARDRCQVGADPLSQKGLRGLAHHFDTA